MRIGLQTDFRDFYDHWFDHHYWLNDEPCDYVLNRMMVDGMSKRQQFALLEEAGFPVPMHGLVSEVVACSSSNPYLVVYTDEMAHGGRGKVLYHQSLAPKEVPDKYCSLFIPTTDDPLTHAVSRRLLAIGDRLWWLRYESNGWMSNHATTVEVTVRCETLDRRGYALEGEHDFTRLNQYPIFAIDFVESLVRNQLMAVDFNSAPGITGTGMEELLSAAEVAQLISDFVAKMKVSQKVSTKKLIRPQAIEFPEDIEVIKAALAEYNLTASEQDIEWAYSQWCEKYYSASWLNPSPLREHRKHLVEVVLEFLEFEEVIAYE